VKPIVTNPAQNAFFRQFYDLAKIIAIASQTEAFYCTTLYIMHIATVIGIMDKITLPGIFSLDIEQHNVNPAISAGRNLGNNSHFSLNM